jgi:hypothetical protein
MEYTQLNLGEEFIPLTKNLFDTWSAQSAYLLGLFYADGHLAEDCDFCLFSTIDFQLTKLVQQLLDYSDVRTNTYSTKQGVRTIYRVQFSGSLAQSLRKLGMPAGAKASWLTWPATLPSHLTRDFVRGFFDGDGSAGKNRPSLTFASSSPQFLEAIESIGRALTCYPREVIFDKNPYGSCYQLQYGNLVDVALWTMYMYLYPTIDLCLARKRDRLFRSLGVEMPPETEDLRNVELKDWNLDSRGRRYAS